MKSSDNPVIENSNQNENLIKPQQQNNQPNIDVNQFFFERNKPSENNKYTITFLLYRILVPSLVIPLLCATIVPVTVVKGVKLYIKLISIFSGVIISLIALIFSMNKLEIIKDKSNNKIIVKIINFLCFPTKIIKLDIENFHFYIEKIYNYDSAYIKLTIINDYKNLVDIDLDTSNIKQKPAKFYYLFDNVRQINNAVNQYTLDLNNFLGISSDNYTNPLLFDINNYMNKNTNTSKSYFGNNLSRYMKFSDHLFTYYLRNPLYGSCIDHSIIAILLVSNICIISFILVILINNIKSIKYLGYFIFVFWNITLFIIYKLLKICFENIYRIDCIFSKDFDRIFIGLVKYTKTSYVNTFEFPMNNIDKFILEKISNENYDLMIIFKNNEKRLICNIKKNQQDLEGLAYLLNEKLIKI